MGPEAQTSGTEISDGMVKTTVKVSSTVREFIRVIIPTTKPNYRIHEIRPSQPTKTRHISIEI